MKKLLFLTSMFYLFTQVSLAQAPKWVEKAKRSVFSIVTYDNTDKILNTGNGFFVSEDGVALSDYSLFKGAQRAVIINAEGKQMPVSSILGAHDMYDVIKFQVALTEKKVPALQVTSTPPAVDAVAYLLPYSTQKNRTFTQGKVKDVSKIANDYFYYTLDLSLKEKMISCPVMTAEGQVFGLAQRSSGQDTTLCYAAGADFALSQTIGALSLNDAALKNIGIKKALPNTEEQALIYIFMASSQVAPEEYVVLLNDYVDQYPNSADGYVRRANNLLQTAKENTDFQKIESDMNQALKVSNKKEEVYYNLAQMIYSYQLTKPENVYKDWTFDKALAHLNSAYALNPQPIYSQLEGDIHFAKQDYAKALVSYEKLNSTPIASAESFFNAAKTKELLEADPKEIVVLLDSCIARCPQPMTADMAPYLLERAQMNMNAEQYRAAMFDYDAYYKAVSGQVNDVFYYYREQAAFKAKQYQRALDDIVKAIELNPEELLYRAEHAVVNLRVGRYEEAISTLNEALKLDPKYAEAYRLLGICQIQLKNKAEACANFAKAKELGDTNVDELISKHCK